VGISYRGFFLHRYSGEACSHHLLLRVHFPAYANADQGAEDASWAFGESAARHLRTWWEAHELPRICTAEHEPSLVGEATDEHVDADGPLLGPGLRTLEIWVAPLDEDGRYVLLAPAADALERPAERQRVYLLTDEDGKGDLSESRP
jgi:hypothetical protein